MDKEISKTELKYSKSKPIDLLNSKEAITLMIQEQKDGIDIINKQVKSLIRIIDQVYEHLLNFSTGRIIYCGAGTSGRIGVQDGAELYPTFGWPKDRTDFLIAGGKNALVNSFEGAEDNVQKAEKFFNKLNICSKDVVIGIAASGNTPFTCEVQRKAKRKKALTIGITNNPNGKIIKFSKLNLILDTGQEVIAGSTRLKAGTVQKVCLNIISSMVMIKFGFVKNGLMNNMVPMNEKLRLRKKMIEKIYRNLEDN